MPHALATALCDAHRIRVDARRRYGLLATECAAVITLLAGETRAGVLAASIGMSPAGITRLTRRLEDDGHLQRRRCPEDARAILLSLTGDGRRLAEQMLAEEIA